MRSGSRVTRAAINHRLSRPLIYAHHCRRTCNPPPTLPPRPPRANYKFSRRMATSAEPLRAAPHLPLAPKSPSLSSARPCLIIKPAIKLQKRRGYSRRGALLGRRPTCTRSLTRRPSARVASGCAADVQSR